MLSSSDSHALRYSYLEPVLSWASSLEQLFRKDLTIMSHFNMFYFAIVLFMYVSYVIFQLGKFTPTKTDEFSEKFKTAVDPPSPHHFRKIMLRIFSEIHDRSTPLIMDKIRKVVFDVLPKQKIDYSKWNDWRHLHRLDTHLPTYLSGPFGSILVCLRSS